MQHTPSGAAPQQAPTRHLQNLVIVGVTRARRRQYRATSEHRALRQAEERLRALVDHSSDAIVVVAPDSTVLYEAGSPGDVLGVEAAELHGGKLCELIEPEGQPLLLTLCRTVGHEDAEVRLRGGARTCEIRATSLLEHPSWEGVVLHIWDVSDRKTLVLELRLAQKLEAVGQLAAAIAHEINTPIQFIGDTNRFLDGAFADLQIVLDAYASLLTAARAAAVTTDLVQRVEEAEQAADIEYLRERIPEAFVRSSDGIQRVASIVGAMRSFADPPSIEASLVDLNESIRNTLIVATNEYKYVADVKIELGDLPPVACNTSDINQVLLNIIINAADAIAEVVGESKRRGLIEVRSWAEGDSVVVTISDTGPGIAPEHVDRVFDPFFTTKEVGRGTGQGLAISRTLIVERHHGSLTFESRPRGGTTFVIRLPARGTIAEPAAAAA